VVTKEMISTPVRRVGRLVTTVKIPGSFLEEDRQRLENAGRNCPVYKSIHPEIETPVTFIWG
jgi:putative redox protein